MATPSIGDLRERVELQSMSPTRDAIGGEVQGWTTLANVWAQVTPMSAGEQYRRQQMQASAQWKVTIRYRADITSKMRVLWSGRTFQVKGVTSADERKRFLAMACEEIAAP